MVVDLLWEQCPKACTNFLKLCKAKYYNYNTISTIRKDQLCYFGERDAAHGGSISAWGLADGGPKYFVPEVQSAGSAINFASQGTVAFTTTPSHGRPGFKHEDLLADSQFCISLNDGLHDHDMEMSIFGNIVEGLDTLNKINSTLTDVSGKPLKQILILHSHILDDPFEDIRGVEFPEESPPPTPRQLELIGEVYGTEEVDAAESDEEIREKKERDREARAQALTLEIIGDLPFAEVKPEENILFVCKLNPVTGSEDLELIFSRFGKIISCEVIRDQDTNESLQYAFIEFDKKEDCERAYFKMEGVLIDDRRIHVDFSQSVGRLAGSWRNKSNEKRQAAHGKRFQSINRSVSPSEPKHTERHSSGRDSDRGRERDRGRDRDNYRPNGSDNSKDQFGRDRDRYGRDRDERSNRRDDEKSYRSDSHRERSSGRDRDRRDRDRDRYTRRSNDRDREQGRDREHRDRDRDRDSRKYREDDRSDRSRYHDSRSRHSRDDPDRKDNHRSSRSYH